MGEHILISLLYSCIFCALPPPFKDLAQFQRLRARGVGLFSG